MCPSFNRRGDNQLSPSSATGTNIIAHDRAQNERQVLRPCSFGFVKRGIQANTNQEFVNMVWQNINFRCNFIYAPLSRRLLAEWAQKKDGFVMPECNGHRKSYDRACPRCRMSIATRKKVSK